MTLTKLLPPNICPLLERLYIQYTNVGPIFLRTPAMTIGNVGSVIENLDGGTKNKKILKNLKVSTVSISVAVSVTDSVCHSPCLCHYHYLQP